MLICIDYKCNAPQLVHRRESERESCTNDEWFDHIMARQIERKNCCQFQSDSSEMLICSLSSHVMHFVTTTQFTMALFSYSCIHSDDDVYHRNNLLFWCRWTRIRIQTHYFVRQHSSCSRYNTPDIETNVRVCVCVCYTHHRHTTAEWQSINVSNCNQTIC